MFLGTATPKIDEKFRLALPTKFREELAKDVSVVCEMDGCLGIYRRPDFEEIMAQATVAPTTFRDVRHYKRWLGSKSENLSLDAQGRVTLNSTQRGWAHLDREAVVIGAGDRVEVWNPDIWAKHEAELDAQFLDYNGHIGPDTTP